MTALNSTGRPARQGAILRIGDLLVSEGLATPAQVQSALCEQYSSQTYRPLGHILIAQKVVTRRQLMSILARYRRSAKLGQLHINFFDLDTIHPDTSLRTMINPRFAEARLVVPMARVENTLVVAMDDPT